MNCMKCGVEIDAGQVFCHDCLKEMANYPIKPGTVVQLPRRQEGPANKKPAARRSLSAEEQIKQLKIRLRILTVLWLVTLALLAALAYPAILYLDKDDFLPGQNYSSITSGDTDVSRETSAPPASEP